ncbi:hypothetical protein Glove_37g84 [Diversispora epigaea]|uniref:Protein kinase domain-containing protein n=1 Tax=Diversispora epigaea TaxID=1348612 RepID=A0A397JJ57_9GLOM|nr:hypothetical protein Glove_37g84 [Diversispora epigaea]
MSQEKTTKEWETQIENLIVEDKFQEENIPFYQYSEFENVKFISGNVYKATFKISQKTIALKCVSLHDKFTLDYLINEVKRHRKIEIHDSILRFYGVTKQENTNNYLIILEYVNNGSLRQYLETNFQKINWNVKLNLAKQIANIVMYLHSDNITHEKLNSENILVHDENIKINDFGMFKHISESLKFQLIDPNTIEKNKCSDIFSLGTILWEISSGKPSSELNSNIDLLNSIVKGEREMITPGIPSKYKEIYIDCWKHDENSRPNISQVVKNLSEIIISSASVKFGTSLSHPYNGRDEVTSFKSEKPNKRRRFLQISKIANFLKFRLPKFSFRYVKVNRQNEHHFNPSFIDVEIDEFIKDLFELFINLYEKQTSKMQLIMIKTYIRECNKNPVKVLSEMNRHPSHYWFTSLIGFFYLYGIGTVVDNEMAFEFFGLAANEITDMKYNSFTNLSLRKLYNFNKEIGLIYLANMYLTGRCVRKDMKKAFQMYSKVSDEGSIIALHNVAYCYEGGFGVKKNEGKAFELYLKLAKEGYPVAQYDVGRCYSTGKGISKDEAKEFQWYIKSALAGNIFAMCNAGFCYDYGTGVERDEGEAFKWYSRAAEKGHSLAQHNLGWCYKNGEGIEKNQAEAFKWFDRAANNGYIDSQYMVGKYFYEGCGTEKDIVKAICWLNIAKERGDSDANDLLKEIISKGIES